MGNVDFIRFVSIIRPSDVLVALAVSKTLSRRSQELVSLKREMYDYELLPTTKILA